MGLSILASKGVVTLSASPGDLSPPACIDDTFNSDLSRRELIMDLTRLF